MFELGNYLMLLKCPSVLWLLLETMKEKTWLSHYFSLNLALSIMYYSVIFSKIGDCAFKRLKV